MAEPYLILCRETNRRGAGSSKSGAQRRRVFKVWKQHRVKGHITDMTDAEVYAALAAQGIDIDVKFPTDATLFLDEISPEEDEDSLMWFVDCTYKPQDSQNTPDDFEDFMKKSNGEQSDDAENPFGPDFSGGGQVIEEYWWHDLDDVPFINVVGSPFQNVPAIPVTIQVDQVTVSERNKPNTALQGYASDRLLLANISYQHAIHKNKKTGKETKYYRNTYVRWTHPYRPWAYVKLLNMGFMEIGDDGKPKTIKVEVDGQKVPVSEARPLSAAGKALPPGSRPSTKKFRIRGVIDGPLGIPFLG